ncbi:MAG: hypothetical protein K1X50_12060 [Candidatus Promineofilum sp.]|nr:hypothetical protein [Promineifilum sp.]MCW5865130.1 hypothetical protein [Anaerolineae bacterium]
MGLVLADCRSSRYDPLDSAWEEAFCNEHFGFPVMSAIHVRNGPAFPFLQEGNANWVPDLVDDEQPAHYYAGLFCAGIFFGADHAAAVNWLRDGPISDNNPPDLRLGYVAGLQGDLLWGRFLSISQVSTAARYALDARLNTWNGPTKL